MRPPGRTAEEIIAALATRAHGVVTRTALLAAGITVAEIKHRLKTGHLIPVHPGVYRVGHAAPSTHATYLAAVRASGDALLCGAAGAFNYGLVRGAAPAPEVLTRRERRLTGVTTRRTRDLDRYASTVWQRIPTLTVPEVLVDLAATLSIAALARAAHEAGVKHGTAPRHVQRALAHRANAKGAANLRAVMSGDARVSLSRLESRFLEILAEWQLPLPVTNKPASGRRVDCRWPAHRLTVELDSYGFHSSRYSWEQDHRREREAYARGDDFRRFTWADVFEDTTAMKRELSCLLVVL